MKKETDLAGVKSIAKMLLMTDVHKTEFSPVVVQHPFTSSGFVCVQKSAELSEILAPDKGITMGGM